MQLRSYQREAVTDASQPGHGYGQDSRVLGNNKGSGREGRACFTACSQGRIADTGIRQAEGADRVGHGA